MSSSDYLLGHEDREWSRLEAQHQLWRSSMLDTLAAEGIGAGSRVLDAGCGTGALLEDLAELVGPKGRALGIELDPVAAARAQARITDCPWASVAEGDLTHADLDGPWDCVVSRWVFSFVPDPEASLAHLAAALAPGGRLIIHDYMHDGIRMFPAAPAFDAVIEGFRAAYASRGGDLWVAGRLPGLMRALGLVDLHLRPHTKAGQPGSPVWDWVGRFVHGHIDTLVADAHLSAATREAFFEEWQQLSEAPDTVLFSPMTVDVIATRPHGDR